MQHKDAQCCKKEYTSFHDKHFNFLKNVCYKVVAAKHSSIGNKKYEISAGINLVGKTGRWRGLPSVQETPYER